MASVPSEVLKLQPDMKRTLDTYDTLENFGVKASLSQRQNNTGRCKQTHVDGLTIKQFDRRSGRL